LLRTHIPILKQIRRGFAACDDKDVGKLVDAYLDLASGNVLGTTDANGRVTFKSRYVRNASGTFPSRLTMLSRKNGHMTLVQSKRQATA